MIGPRRPDVLAGIESRGFLLAAPLALHLGIGGGAEPFERPRAVAIGEQRQAKAGLRIAVPGTSERVHLPLQIIVRDNGPGIPDQELPHVFERFWRGSNGDKATGSGIGLAVVSELVAAHHGTVTAGNVPHGGAHFRITLPAAPPA